MRKKYTRTILILDSPTGCCLPGALTSYSTGEAVPAGQSQPTHWGWPPPEPRFAAVAQSLHWMLPPGQPQPDRKKVFTTHLSKYITNTNLNYNTANHEHSSASVCVKFPIPCTLEKVIMGERKEQRAGNLYRISILCQQEISRKGQLISSTSLTDHDSFFKHI